MFKGGGIIPFTIHKKKIYLLLGRENIYCKNCSHKWADWGGGLEKGENILDTVAREASEESMGFLGSKNKLKKILENHREQFFIGDEYRYYFIPIDYDEKMVDYFNSSKNIIYKYLPKHLLKNNKILEKDKMKWFSLEDLKNNKNNLRKFFKKTSKIIIKNKNNIINYFNKTHKKYIKNSIKGTTHKTKRRKHT